MDIIKKLNTILTKRQKNRIIILIIMIVIGALLETLGISLIVPVVGAIIEKDALTENRLIVMINSFLRIDNINTFVIVMIIIMITVFIVKNLYMLCMYYVQYSFISNNQYRISRDLLQVYLNRPYEFYLNTNTSDILRTVYSDTTGVFSLLLQCIQLVTELTVALCLCAGLMVVDFQMTVILAVILGGTTVIISLLLKPKLGAVGRESRLKQSRMYNSIIQSVMGIKDVKVFHKEAYFLEEYKRQGRRYYELFKINSVLGSVPRLLIETVSIGGILAYLAVMIAMGNDVTNMFTQLSAFAIAASRLMPCANRASTYLASIAYYKPALDYVYENVELPKEYVPDAAVKTEKNDRRIMLKQDLQIREVSYKYPNSEKYILQEAGMTIRVGESVGIIGPSGAGKTTAVDIILGLLSPEKGQILCDGQDVMENYGGWLQNIGYIPQNINLMDDTIRNNVAFGVEEKEIDENRVWEVLCEAQMEEYVKGLPEGLETKIGERGVRISGGQKQRIGIARALYHNPELLILDEATSALDNETESAIMEAIDHFHGRKTMLIIAHRLKTIENCDKIYRVENGKIMEES